MLDKRRNKYLLLLLLLLLFLAFPCVNLPSKLSLFIFSLKLNLFVRYLNIIRGINVNILGVVQNKLDIIS